MARWALDPTSKSCWWVRDIKPPLGKASTHAKVVCGALPIREDSVLLLGSHTHDLVSVIFTVASITSTVNSQ